MFGEQMHDFWLRLKALVRRRELDRDLDDELQFHLAMREQKLREQGVAVEEARYAARRQFGNVTRLKETSRELWGFRSIETFAQDLRYGVRQLRRNPGFTVVAVLTLALGIGANTTIFSVIEAVLLRPLPYHDPSRLAILADPYAPGDLENGGFLYKDVHAWQSQSHTFEDMAVYYRDSGFSRVTLTCAGEPEFVQGAFVSASFFPVMGVSPLLGRVFTSDEEARREQVVILSHGMWVRRFGGSPDAVGKRIEIDGIKVQVIGVMPATFQFPAPDQQFWAPLTTNPNWGDPALTTNIDANHGRYFYARWQAIGRLKPDTSFQQAQAEMSTIFARSARHDPDKNRGSGIAVLPLGVNLRGNTRAALFVLLGAVSFVLLIACSNVANLALARGVAREREMVVRAALGAGRVRLVRQLLTESGVMGLLSGCLGLALASVAVRALVALAPSDISRLEQAGLDAEVLAFTLVISLSAAVIFGLAPAWKVARTEEALSVGMRGASASQGLRRVGSLLVVTEFALAVSLLAGAGRLLRSFLAVEAVDPALSPSTS